jgi:hypothetical protein
MEFRFGHDFAHIRIHTDSMAQASARDINAVAYTVGNHIAFGSHQYKPREFEGKQLLAHELGHTIQQNSGNGIVQRKVSPSDQCSILKSQSTSHIDLGAAEDSRRFYYKHEGGKVALGSLVDGDAVIVGELIAGQREWCHPLAGCWRPVCATNEDLGLTTPQVMWVLGAYIQEQRQPTAGGLRRPRLKEALFKPSDAEAAAKPLIPEQTPKAESEATPQELNRLKKAVRKRQREQIEDNVLGWGRLLFQARDLRETDPETCEKLLRFVWSRIDPITEPHHLDQKLQGLGGIVKRDLRFLAAVVRSGLKKLIGHFHDPGGPPPDHYWTSYVHWTPVAQQLLAFLNGETSAYDSPLIQDLQAVQALTSRVWAAVGITALAGPVVIKLMTIAAGRLWILSYSNPVLATEIATLTGGAVIEFIHTGEIPMSPMDLVELWIIVRSTGGAAGRPRRIRGRVETHTGDRVQVQVDPGEAQRPARLAPPSKVRSMVGAAPRGFAPEGGEVYVQSPRCTAHESNVITRPDPTLVDLAKYERIHNAGLTREAFHELNVAVAKVRINGDIEYLSAGSSPSVWGRKIDVQEGGIVVGKRRKPIRKQSHSEQYIDEQIQSLRESNPGKTVMLDQLYTERWPCRKICTPMLRKRYPEAQIFYTVKGEGKGAQLMREYGVEAFETTEE